MEKNRASWSGQLAFVIAAAASAIGLGNLWRFPYLAAHYGGGTFILIYLLLTVTLGFTLLVTEIAIGRMTRQSQLTAYTRLKKGWGGVGIAATLVPMLILPYYCVIGGWVLKYLLAYAQMAFTGEALMGADAAGAGDFFGNFMAGSTEPLVYGLVFALICAVVILMGVKNGIEKSNLVMMPVLLAMSLAIAVYILFLDGVSDGLKYYLVPNMDGLRDVEGNFSFALLAKTVLGAMGQMFFSLSIAMGIMVTYGSYMKRQDSIEKSVRRIEIFDTFIAVLAGLMIIPVVHMFSLSSPHSAKCLVDAGCEQQVVRQAAVAYVENNATNDVHRAAWRTELDGRFALIDAKPGDAKVAAENWSAIKVDLKSVSAVCAPSAPGSQEKTPDEEVARKARKALVDDSMNAGPGLMFVTLPKVFARLGPTAGNWVGFAFFVLVAFAAATSCISIFEACVAAVSDRFHLKRGGATGAVTAGTLVLAVLPALGFGVLKEVTLFGMDFLTFFDFVTNSVLMPLVALATCVFVGWVIRPKTIVDECELDGHVFKAKGLYAVMVKYLAPLLVIAVLVSEVCRALGLGGWSI